MWPELEQLCTLTEEQINKVILAKWKKKPYSSVVTINYTFDLEYMPAQLKEEIHHNFKHAVTSSLSESSRNLVREVFERWLPACGNNIQLNYVEQLGDNQDGITLIACDKLSSSSINVNGVTFYNTPNNKDFFHQVLVCLPSVLSTPYDLKTYFHEIGHAFGLDHTHKEESIVQQLRKKEGLGCSVMLYADLMQSPENDCTIPEYCLDQNYAIFPGPMDKQICTTLYQPPSFSMSQCFNALFKGALNSAMENVLFSYLSNLECLHMEELNLDIISLSIGLLVRYPIHDTSTFLSSLIAAAEVIAKLNEHNSAHLFKALRTLSNLAGISMSLYFLYGDESPINNSIYLIAFLAASIGGARYGSSLGKETAGWTNSLITCLSPLLNSGINTVSNRVPGVTGITGTVGSLRNWFFGKSAITEVDEEKKIGMNTVDAVESSLVLPATL